MNRCNGVIFTVLLVLLLAACSTKIDSKHQATLYEQLGAHQGMERLVNTVIKKIAKDEQIFPYFAKASVSHFKQGFMSHLCQTTGGPCQYTGDTMVDIHTGMNINEADFNRVVELLIEAMEEIDITYQTQNRVLAKLAPLRAQIIKI
ncbi:group 1 truncated hemoglobin [Thalassotalea sp. G2M2-11]|uniref:group I truncated hemoglobin n=1 Tax=Thalassotalea sp. G2M2-11 TaxID=2787627 RepID=UPI0019CF97E8|nr:group 1 truncated hemoglobin [Thalassotalea sp. G2M2-11]